MAGSDTLLICPTCGQRLPAKGRICAICEKPIKRDHRWHIEGSRVVHDNCEEPRKES